MRAVLQRVSSASVIIDSEVHNAIGTGFLVLLGVEEEDGIDDLDYLVSKICNIRVFGDAEGKMNLDIRQAGGEILVISQFTLHASTRKGNRPSFIKAARPEKAQPLYEQFITQLQSSGCVPCKTGVFGA